MRGPATQGASRRETGRRRKADIVSDALGRRIVAGPLAPGSRLPTEAELGRRFKISRASLREGLKALAAKGLVETRKRGGTVVCARARWNLLDPDILAWIAAGPPDATFLEALLEVRGIIEPAAARLAAERASPADIAEIERQFQAMAGALPDDAEACCRHDLAFHEAIIEASGNALLRCLAAPIRSTLLAAFRISVSARESYENSLAEHWAVAVAIRRRSPAAAERAMRLLLAGTARDTAPALKKSEVRPKSPKSKTIKEETDERKHAPT